MRKIIWMYIMIIFFEYECTAQTYFHTPDSNAIWSVEWWSSTFTSSNYLYHITGDSSINGKLYHVLQSNHSQKYAYREDTNKKVYIIDFYRSNTEYELYDFSLGVGDSVHTYSTAGPISTTIASIDSILILGTHRKKWVLSNSCGNNCALVDAFWIEGIGSVLGFINGSFILNESFIELICFKQDNQLVYSSYPSQDCFEVRDILSQKKSPSFYVYPTVAKEEINISFQEAVNENIDVFIYNCLGEKIYSQSLYLSGHSKIAINISDLSHGLYFLSLTDREEKVGVTKFVKE